MKPNRRAPLARSCALALLMALVGAGCAASPRPSGGGGTPSVGGAPQGASGLDTTSHIDETTGVISFPSDRFSISFGEMDALASAGTYLIADCAREKNEPFEPFPPADEPLYDVSTYFGVWTTDIAARFAFVSPGTPADLRANGVAVDAGDGTLAPGSTPSQGAAPVSEELVNTCSQSPEYQKIDPARIIHAGPWAQEFSDATQAALDGVEAKKVVADYDTCLESEGLQPSKETPFGVTGMNPSVISEEQIQLATKVVACKSDVQLVRRLSDLVAKAQAPIVDRYAAELAAQRQRIDTALAQARSIIAAHAG